MKQDNNVKKKNTTKAKRGTSKAKGKGKKRVSAKIYSDAAIIEAIRGSGGILVAAAQALGCERTIIYLRAKETPAIQEAIDEARESIKDMAEGVVYTAINSGCVETAKWYLSRQAKARGYGDKVEQDVNINKAPILELILHTEKPENGV